MAVREFDGVDDDITTALGALSAMTHGAVAAIIKVDDTGSLKTLLGLHNSGGSAQLSLGVDFNEFNYWWVHGSERVEGQQLTAGTWYLWVIRKGTGNLVPRASLYDFTAGTWDHGGVNNDVIDSTAPGASGSTRLATGGSNLFSGRVAVRAAWSNSIGPADAWTTDATGDAAIEAAGLEAAASNWLDESPDAMWRFNQAATTTAVEDDTGNGADETSLTGTTVITGDDPPGFDFSLSAGTPLGRVTETGTARGFTASKSAEIDRITETGAPRSLTGSKTRQIGRVTGTSATRTLGASKARQVGRITDSGAVRSFTLQDDTTIGRVVEIGTARSFTADKTLQLGRVTGASDVRSLTHTLAFGRVTGSGTVRTLDAAKTGRLGRVVETGTVRTLIVGEIPEATPIILPPFREQSVAAFRELSVPDFQEAS